MISLIDDIVETYIPAENNARVKTTAMYPNTCLHAYRLSFMSLNISTQNNNINTV